MNSRTPVRLGAVEYLNMLPFFFEDPHVELFPTPAALNRALAQGNVHAGCSSVAAGLDLRLREMRPLTGVAARSSVGSVYLELVSAGSESENAWNALRSFTAEAAFAVSEKLRERALRLLEAEWATFDSVEILTSGASAQSLWIVRQFFERLKKCVQIRQIASAANLASPGELHRMGQGALKKRGIFSLFLVIGDQALLRKCLVPEMIDGARLDIAKLWQSQTGLPCLFALWFLHPQLSDSLIQLISETVRESLLRWGELTAGGKFELARGFLVRTGRGQLAELLGTDRLAMYMENLCFDLDEPMAERSFSLMQSLFLGYGVNADSAIPDVSFELDRKHGMNQ